MKVHIIHTSMHLFFFSNLILEKFIIIFIIKWSLARSHILSLIVDERSLGVYETLRLKVENVYPILVVCI